VDEPIRDNRNQQKASAKSKKEEAWSSSLLILSCLPRKPKINAGTLKAIIPTRLL